LQSKRKNFCRSTLLLFGFSEVLDYFLVNLTAESWKKVNFDFLFEELCVQAAVLIDFKFLQILATQCIPPRNTVYSNSQRGAFQLATPCIPTRNTVHSNSQHRAFNSQHRTARFINLWQHCIVPTYAERSNAFARIHICKWFCTFAWEANGCQEIPNAISIYGESMLFKIRKKYAVQQWYVFNIPWILTSQSCDGQETVT